MTSETTGNDEPVILLAVLKDIHNLGVLVLKHALESAGFRVANAGAGLSQDEIVASAIETGARAALISSSYGMAALDAQGLRDKCEEAGLRDLLLYIGGNLSVTRQRRRWEEIEDEFRTLGFDRAYPNDVSLETVIADLRRDLAVPVRR